MVRGRDSASWPDPVGGREPDRAKIMRWKQEEELLRQRDQDDRTRSRHAVLWTVGVLFLLLDLTASLAVILDYTK
jgi:hypothetical protein